MAHDVGPTLRTRSALLSLLLAGFLSSSCGNDTAPKPGVDVDMAMTPTACSLTCRDLKNCRLSCGTGAACFEECDAYASAEVKATYAAAMACVNEHGCKDDPCIAQFCAAPVAACLPPVADVPPPKTCAATCIHITACLVGCNDDPACSRACVDTAIAPAKRDYEAALACAKVHGCADFTGKDCDATACLAVFDQCAPSTP
jgi:hypothetical protein